jgi:hypothetical protein
MRHVSASCATGSRSQVLGEQPGIGSMAAARRSRAWSGG